jgi:hypothetical protein
MTGGNPKIKRSEFARNGGENVVVYFLHEERKKEKTTNNFRLLFERKESDIYLAIASDLIISSAI